MKGRYILLIISLLLGAVEVMAGSVTREQARQRAEAFLKGKVISQDVASRRSLVGKNGMEVEPLYVFNAEGEQGFVIVSGCDETEPILGYSHKGSFDMEHMPENVRAWIEGYRSQIETMFKTDGHRDVARRSQTEWQAIGPLVTTEWSQRDPYYRLCPEYNGEKCVTGCAATAMAQILYYLKCPNEATPSIGSFTTSELKIEVPELPSTTFDWEKMLPSYTGDFTDEEGEAVAKLMRYCGQAVHMDYTPSASGRKTITICTDDELKNVVYSFEADIVDTPSQELSGNMTLNDLIIKDYAHYAAGDGSLPVTVVVKNEKDEKFDDQIFFVIGSYRDHYETEIMGSMSVVLEPGEEKAFDYRVKNLKKGQEYTVEACYFSCADLITLDSYKFRCFNAGLKVDSVYFNTVKTGRWSSYAYADVENTGDAHWDWLLMSVGEEETSAELDLNPGERGTVRFPIFMETPGDYEVKIYSSWGGEGVFYTGTISVGEPSSQELTCKTGFKDAVMVNDEWGIPRNSLAGTAPVVTLQVKNEGENVYDDDVLLLMNYYNEQDEHSEYEKFIHAEVTPGDGVDLAVAFPDMGKGRCYVVVYYYSNNDMVYMGDSECVLGVPVDIKGVRVERKDRHPMRVYGIDGRAVPGNAKLEKGIYIVEGKKFVVK